MSGNQSKNKKGSLLKTSLLYVFLLFLAYIVSDLTLLKFVRPQFMVQISAKDKVNPVRSFEPETDGFEISELGAKSSFTDKIVSRNIFNSGDMPLPLAKLQNSEQIEEIEDNEPVLSGLQLVLEGTAVHRNPFRSLATIKNADKILSYTVGDDVGGLAEIISVIRKKVIIRNFQNKRLEYIEISRSQVQPTQPVVRAKSPIKNNSLIRRDGNRFTAKRADVNAQLANITSLARQANSRLARDPATGEILGYQIFGIKPGLLQDLGVQEDDIISSINGMQLKNPLDATSAFGKLKGANEINVTINRGGELIELEYNIVE